MRSIVSSIGAGPTAQLTPMSVAPRRSSSGANRSGGVPSSVFPSSSVVICATIGRSDDAAHGVDRRADLVQVAERLEDEQIDAAVEERLRLLAEALARLVDAGLAPRLDADAERADRAGDVRALADRVPRDAARPARLMSCSLSARPKEPSLIRFAPKVLVSTTSAPARTYSSCTRMTRSGCVRFSASKLLLMKTPLRVQHRAHRAVADEHAVLRALQEWLHR